MPRVNAAILKWARETAGLSLDEAAERIQLNDARGVSGADRLAALEEGEAQPTRPQLVRMAKQYRRPLLAFYLTKPPRAGNRGHDFRTLPDGYAGDQEPILDALVRDILVRQALLRSAIEDENEAKSLPWVGSTTVEISVRTLVERMHEALQLSLADYRAAADAEEAFGVLRDRVERLGAFVILASNLGSHHTSIGVEVFRGFAFADPIAPFLVINDQDSRAAWSFTLLHELTHLWLGLTGISGGRPDRETERFCNEVASEFLVPDEEIRAIELPSAMQPEDIEQLVTKFSRVRNVSRSLVAYRLYRENKLTELQWRAVTEMFRQQWMDRRKTQRDSLRDSEGGPSYYVVRRHRLGALVRETSRLLSGGALTTTEAGQVLGVKPGNVGTLLAADVARSHG